MSARMQGRSLVVFLVALVPAVAIAASGMRGSHTRSGGGHEQRGLKATESVNDAPPEYLMLPNARCMDPLVKVT